MLWVMLSVAVLVVLATAKGYPEVSGNQSTEVEVKIWPIVLEMINDGRLSLEGQRIKSRYWKTFFLLKSCVNGTSVTCDNVW